MKQVQKHYNTGVNILQEQDIKILIGYLKSRVKRKRRTKEAIGHAAQISLALFSALRVSEVAGLRWSDIRQGFDFRKWFVPWNAKRLNRMPALMNSISEEVLEEIFQRKEKSDWVFPGFVKGEHITSVSIYRAWKRVQCELWGFDSYSFHDLRHTSITNFYRASRDINQTAQFARHKSFITTQRYIHLVEREACEEVMRTVENEFKNIVGFVGERKIV